MVPVRHRCSVITFGLTFGLAVLAGSVSAGTPPCAYSLSPLYAIFDHPAASGSFQVTANDQSCSWYAYNNTAWIAVTNGASHTGSGPLNFNVAENDTPHQRLATIRVTGFDGFDEDFTIIQNHPWIPVNFDIDAFSPEIGETVTFSTDPRLEVLSWSFTSPDCEGRLPTVFCSGVAGECNEIQWAWKHPGPKEITMETTTGSQTKIYTVQDTGQCPDSCGGVGPDDGTVENGYGWSTGRVFVQRFTPDVTPFFATDVCAAFTQAGGDSSLAYDVVIYDDDGPVGDTGLLAGVSGPTRLGTLWTSPDGLTWSQSSSPGFSNPDNRSVETLEYWDGRFFAGTSNPTAGCEVWRGASSSLFDDGFETGDTSRWHGTAP